MLAGPSLRAHQRSWVNRRRLGIGTLHPSLHARRMGRRSVLLRAQAGEEEILPRQIRSDVTWCCSGDGTDPLNRFVTGLEKEYFKIYETKLHNF